jgi:hypothetical protein
MNDLDALAKLAQALSPWRTHLVFIGGWAHRMHRFSPLPSSMEVQVANPLCFIVQKFLIQKDRPAAKQAQDVLYIYDTIELFGALLDEFHETWKSSISPALGEKLSNTVLTLSKNTFSNTNEVIRAAARIPQDRKLSPEQIQRTCLLAFETILPREQS